MWKYRPIPFLNNDDNGVYHNLIHYAVQATENILTYRYINIIKTSVSSVKKDFLVGGAPRDLFLWLIYRGSISTLARLDRS